MTNGAFLIVHRPHRITEFAVATSHQLDGVQIHPGSRDLPAQHAGSVPELCQRFSRPLVRKKLFRQNQIFRDPEIISARCRLRRQNFRIALFNNSVRPPVRGLKSFRSQPAGLLDDAVHRFPHPFCAEIFHDARAALPRQFVPQTFITVRAHDGPGKLFRRIRDQGRAAIAKIQPIRTHGCRHQRHAMRQREQILRFNSGAEPNG